MKKNHLFLPKGIMIFTAIFFAALITSNATVWRINNRPNVDADFTNLQAAVNAASAGDTLYVEGSPTNYGGAQLSKQLVIIGAGYFLSQNDSTQAYTNSSKVGLIYCYNGSQGSVLEGLHFIVYSNYTTTGVDVQTSNITIRRNRFQTQSLFGGQYSIGVKISQIVSSILVEQNWIEPITPSDGYSSGVSIQYYVSNSTIRNNIIHCDTNHYAINIGQVNEAASLTISNNALMGDVNTNYSAHYNNILIYGSYTAGAGDITSNNLCNQSQYPAVNSNQQNVVMSAVFEDYTTYIDNGYLLATGSPAAGAGVGGVDCGPFGTHDPYRLSGIPPIPAIFEVDMEQSIGTTTLPVTVKAKSHQ